MNLKVFGIFAAYVIVTTMSSGIETDPGILIMLLAIGMNKK